MTSRTTEEFWQRYLRLPARVRQTVRQCYALWQANHSHPGLHFKQVHPSFPLYSVRVGMHHRAVGLREQVDGEDTIVWFFVGTHAEYDQLLAQF
jgi:hypothetical protein